MLYSNKNEQTIATCNDVDDSNKHDVGPKKADIKSCMLHSSVYINCKSRQN